MPPHELGQLRPDEFIPLAEENGLITEITYQVLHKTCLFLQQLQQKWYTDEGHQREFFSSHVFTAGSGKYDSQHHAEYGIPAKLLQIELTESMLARDPHMITAFMQRMKQEGIEFLLDDFGTGDGKFSALSEVRYDYIKIARELFVDAASVTGRTHTLFSAFTSNESLLSRGDCRGRRNTRRVA